MGQGDRPLSLSLLFRRWGQEHFLLHSAVPPLHLSSAVLAGLPLCTKGYMSVTSPPFCSWESDISGFTRAFRPRLTRARDRIHWPCWPDLFLGFWLAHAYIFPLSFSNFLLSFCGGGREPSFWHSYPATHSTHALQRSLPLLLLRWHDRLIRLPLHT